MNTSSPYFFSSMVPDRSPEPQVDPSLYVGSHWTEPAPIRSVEAEHPWLPVLYVVVGVIAVVASALAPLWVQP